MIRILALCSALLFPAAAQADEIEEALTAALEAYADGDVAFALEELDFARAKLLGMKADALTAFLPEAPEGWTRELDTDIGQSLGLMGGGSGAAADYIPPDGGEGVFITLMADSPMVTGMAAMISNAGVMGLPVERVGRQKFVVQDEQMTALIANRVLVQAESSDTEAMMTLLELIDFGALGTWGL